MGILNMKNAIAMIAASLSLSAMAQTQVSAVSAEEAGTVLNKFTGSFLYLGHFNADNVDHQTGAHDDEYQYRLGYKITPNTTLGVLGAFVYNKVGTVSDAPQGDISYYDSAVTATTKAGSLFGSDPVALDFRIYAPTSRAAVYAPTATRDAQLRVDAVINYPITSKIAAGIAFSPRHVIQREAANTTRLISSPSISYSFTNALSTYFAVNDDFKVASDANKTMLAHTMGPEVGVNYTANKNLDLALIVTQERNVLDPSGDAKGAVSRAEYSFFYAKETDLQLQGVMHF